jgi:hypothetical protein
MRHPPSAKVGTSVAVRGGPRSVYFSCGLVATELHFYLQLLDIVNIAEFLWQVRIIDYN